MRAPPAPECGADCPCRHIVPIQGPSCRCGLSLLGSGCAYCEATGLYAAMTGNVPKVAQETKDSLLAEYDARVEAGRQATRAATDAQLAAAGVGKPKKAKKPRTPAQDAWAKKRQAERAHQKAQEQAWNRAGTDFESSPNALVDGPDGLPFDD